MGTSAVNSKWDSKGLELIYQSSDNGELIYQSSDPLISEYGYSKFLDPVKACILTSNGYTAPEKSLQNKVMFLALE